MVEQRVHLVEEVVILVDQVEQGRITLDHLLKDILVVLEHLSLVVEVVVHLKVVLPDLVVLVELV